LQFDLIPSIADCAFSVFTSSLAGSVVFVTLFFLFFAPDSGRNLYPDGKSTHPVVIVNLFAALEQVIDSPITSIINVALLSLLLGPPKETLLALLCLVSFFSSYNRFNSSTAF
jgi:hypothetical protein